MTVEQQITNALGFMTHNSLCKSLQPGIDICTCGMEEAYEGLRTVALFSRDANNTRIVSQRARELLAAELRSRHPSWQDLAHQVEADNYAENGKMHVGAALQAIEAALALSRDGEREAIDRCARIVEAMVPAPAGGPFSHTNSMRVVLIDAVNAIRALATPKHTREAAHDGEAR